MLITLWKQQIKLKYLLQDSAFFIFFFGFYTYLDYLNLPYAQMAEDYGLFLPILNIIINLIMATLSALMLGLTSAQLALTGKESQAANVSFISVFFGFLTYGCTPCVIAFFAAIGISFSVMVLPWAGFPYKVISLVLVIGGFLWVLYQLRHASCEIKSDPNNLK